MTNPRFDRVSRSHQAHSASPGGAPLCDFISGEQPAWLGSSVWCLLPDRAPERQRALTPGNERGSRFE